MICPEINLGYQQMIKQLRHWLCRQLCKDRLFNSDMSLVIDKQVVELEKNAHAIKQQAILIQKLREQKND